MIASHQIAYILLAHFISRFLLQSDTMSSQKMKHFSWAMLHVAIYSFSLFFIMLLGIVVFKEWTWNFVWNFSLINSVAYFIIEVIVGGFNCENKDQKRYYLYGIGIGFEQFAHAIVLIYSSSYLLA